MQGRTPLHIATELACEEAIAYLLSVGANPTLKDKRGRKPVHIARADTEHPHIYEAFSLKNNRTERRADRGPRTNKDPNMRLFKAIQFSQVEEVERLLKVEAKNIHINGTSRRGHSPIYLGMEENGMLVRRHNAR